MRTAGACWTACLPAVMHGGHKRQKAPGGGRGGGGGGGAISAHLSASEQTRDADDHGDGELPSCSSPSHHHLRSDKAALSTP